MFAKIQNFSDSIIIGTIILIFLTTFIIGNLLLYYYKRRKHFQESNKMKAEFSRTLLQTQLEIQEQTLKTISQEIHDNIGQVLSLAKLNLNTIDFTNESGFQEKIADSKNLVSKAIQDLRDLSKSLNTDSIAAMGLVKALEYEADMIRKGGYLTQLHVAGDIVKMEPQKELIIFRIVQETLNNIIKHADAKQIQISATYLADKLELQVSDDGHGVDLSPLNENKKTDFGQGIRNMHSRATLVGAEFSMNSILEKGTTVKLIIPYINLYKNGKESSAGR